MIKLLVRKIKEHKSTFVLTMLCSSALLNLGFLSAAQAASIRPSFTLNPSPPDPSNLFNPGALVTAEYVLGYNFEIDLESRLNAVGIFSTATAHTIGIWDASNYTDLNPVLGRLEWQKQITEVNTCQTISSYCWFTLSDGPVLKAGNKYVVAATWGSENVPVKLNSATAVPTPGNGLTTPSFAFGRVANSGSVSNGLLVDFSVPAIAATYTPNDTDPTSAVGFLSVNLSFDNSAPPTQTPAPLPLFGAAAAFSLSRKIRRRINPAS